MKRAILILAIFSITAGIVSCAAPKEAVKGTGKGAEEIIEGTGKGVVGLGKGAVGTVTGTVGATGELLTGQGDDAIKEGKQAVSSGGEGISSIIVEPATGLGKGLQAIDKGIKKATGNEDEEEIK